jgi:hypothetical protein
MCRKKIFGLPKSVNLTFQDSEPCPFLTRIIRDLLDVLRRKPYQLKVGGTIIQPHGRLIALKKSPIKPKSELEQVQVGEQVTAILKRDEEITAIRIADSVGQSVSANILEDGSVDYLIQGKSRQNEEGILEVCKILIERLNRDGANWHDLKDIGQVEARKEQGVDCQAKDGETTLAIQVTRAEIDGKVWKTLNQVGEVSAHLSAKDAANSLYTAIQKKALKIPPRQRPQITLALDATETASHIFGPVLEAFALQHREGARALKFNGIWLVGPTISLTSRLDE